MKVVFCGLTGLGNIVLKELIKLKVDIVKVYTREEKANFPILLVKIYLIMQKNNLPVSFEEIKKDDEADLCLVSTYHKKIKLNNLSFKKAINIHPSYLPHFKGRDPINDEFKIKALLRE